MATSKQTSVNVDCISRVVNIQPWQNASCAAAETIWFLLKSKEKASIGLDQNENLRKDNYEDSGIAIANLLFIFKTLFGCPVKFI